MVSSCTISFGKKNRGKETTWETLTADNGIILELISEKKV
jgi:hypothetical protein